MLRFGCRPDLLCRSPREEQLVNKDGCVEAFSRGSLLVLKCSSQGKGRDGLLCFVSETPLPLGGEAGGSSLPSVLLMLRDLKSLGGPWHCRPLQGSSVTHSLLYTEEVWGYGRYPLAPAPFQSPFKCPGATIENRFRGNWVT